MISFQLWTIRNIVQLFLLIFLRHLTQLIMHYLKKKQLLNIGFDDVACNWFHSYLMDRQQCVAIGDIKSKFVQVTKGVLQGSVLGPVLFTLYINNIVSVISGCNFHFYADDTVLYCVSDTAQSATDSLQHCFAILEVALNNIKLVLDAEKTKFMLFTKAKNIIMNNLIITTKHGTIIERVLAYKYLGINIDEKLSFKNHVLVEPGE